jgi:acyl-CoA synthetase (NDP forming)
MGSEPGHAMRTLFSPRGVAVVGASSRLETLPGKALVRLRQHDFRGTVIAVNPRHSTMHGYECVGSVLDLPDGIDVAMLMLRADLVPQAVLDCGARGIGVAVVLSSGFEDSEAAAGLNAELRAALAASRVRVVGPNCEGIWSIPSSLTLTFGSAADRARLLPGPVSIISQSGSVGGACIRELQERGVGCRYFVSSGNELDLSTLDFCEFMLNEGGSSVIAMFIEGLRDGGRLRQLAARARQRQVRLIALRAGQSEQGRVATMSHTGRVATAAAVYRDVFAQCGVLEAATLADFIDAIELAAGQDRLPATSARTDGEPPRGLGVVAISGGSRALLADAAEQHRVPLARFTADTERTLGELLPRFGYHRNPVDTTGALIADQAGFERVLRAVAADENVDTVLVQYANGGDRQLAGHAALYRALSAAAGKPFVASLLAGRPERTGPPSGLEGIVVARDPAESIKKIAWLYRLRIPVTPVPPVPPVPGRTEPGAGESGAGESGAGESGAGELAAEQAPADLDWSQRAALTERIGIPLAAWRTARSADELYLAAAGLRPPLVVKATPEYAEHKTEAGLIYLGLRTPAEALDALRRIQAQLGPGTPVLVQEMLGGCQEMLVAARTDQDLGPVVAFGFGGVLAEWARDICYLSLPVSATEIRDGLAGLRSWELLQAFRGRAPRDVDALVAAVLGLAREYTRSLAGWEIEFNPLLVGARGEGVRAVDILCTPPPQRQQR